MRLLLSALLVLLCVTAVMAQSVPATCGNAPEDVTFKPSNCLEAGGESTLETARFRSVGIVNLFIAGSSGRVGDGDRGVRVDGDGVLRLRIDTIDFFGSQIPAGDYSVIIKDITGRISPIIAPFTVEGDVAPIVSTARATSTPRLPDTSPTATRTSVSGGTPTATRTSAPGGTSTATRTSASGGTPTATVRGTPSRTPTATATLASDIAADLCRQTPDPILAPNEPIAIFAIDEVNETVTLESFSIETVNLDGWTMCSLTGDQVHTGISGDIEFLEFFNFKYDGDIWDDVQRDDGALYDPDGNLVSYFEDLD